MIVTLDDKSVPYCVIAGLVAQAALEDLKENYFTFDNFPEVIVDSDEEHLIIAFQVQGVKTNSHLFEKKVVMRLASAFMSGEKTDLHFFQDVQKMLIELETEYSKKQRNS